MTVAGMARKPEARRREVFPQSATSQRAKSLVAKRLDMDLTFDTNCLVDLELDEGASTELRRLVAVHDSGHILISVPGVGASERLKDGTFAQNFAEFRQRIQKIPQREFGILRPPLYLDVAYFDWAILVGEEEVNLERQIHGILFPETEFKWSDHAEAHGLDPNEAADNRHREWRKWRNRKCDTLALWCHIYYGQDIFITRDGNFHKATKKPALVKLGARSILFPAEVDV